MLADREGHTDARRWAEPFRRGDTPALAAFLRENAEGIGFVAFQQYLADAQLGRAARAGAGIYRDLAVGAAPDGAEVWSGNMAFLPRFVVGAPPDPFAAEGQVWGLPAPDPRALAETGYAGFAALVRANMRHAAALRMDHVLGLKRLFLVPEGARGAEGAYLAYPFDALLGQLALESHAAHCLMVGEDLGTVPEGMGEALQSAKVLSYRVLWFEREGDRFRAPDHYPPRAAACVSTHDLPPLEGWWAGEDVVERARLGLVPDEAVERARRAAEREALLDALEEERLLPVDAHADGPMTDALAAAIHAYIARTPCLLALVQSEDLAGERIGVNLPGTDWERPNWRRRLPVAAGGLLGTPRARAILRTVGGQDAPA
jgi:glycogen operon protein